MLPVTHDRAYQELLTLLREFQSWLNERSPEIDPVELQQQFQNFARWFERNIAQLDSEAVDRAIASRWQSVQTEIRREFKLLSTDILFFSSARQNSTQTKRRKSIGDRLAKLIGYCQILLDK